MTTWPTAPRRRALALVLVAGLAVGLAACSDSDPQGRREPEVRDLQQKVDQLRLEVQNLRQEVQSLREEVAGAGPSTPTIPLGTTTSTTAPR
jgi:outer membrane murein-binding lipoprotein Lpp